ncbi:50S ribosomal protein L13 [Candidatus Woesearchaeota archaeon]|nr:50S ribosomal protein L13 [Candidatus Woesearchaeota archaeon]|tara:strand:+ start:1168 stop:1572 length:405 start_codon:yes stop_codon:yes gene_type:complete
MIINAEKLVLGRMAVIAARQALLGEDVKIVNAEKAIITGDKQSILKHYLSRLELGQPQQGPFIQRRPDLFVRRTIRGMLPRKQYKGRQAFSRIKCYIGVPDNLEKAESLKKAQLQKITKRYITVGELCMHLGGK